MQFHYYSCSNTLLEEEKEETRHINFHYSTEPKIKPTLGVKIAIIQVVLYRPWPRVIYGQTDGGMVWGALATLDDSMSKK